VNTSGLLRKLRFLQRHSQCPAELRSATGPRAASEASLPAAAEVSAWATALPYGTTAAVQPTLLRELRSLQQQSQCPAELRSATGPRAASEASLPAAAKSVPRGASLRYGTTAAAQPTLLRELRSLQQRRTLKTAE